MATPSGASPQTAVQNGQPGKKAIIEEKFRKFWEQLKNGCGGCCNYTFCASNPAFARFKLTPNEMAATALSLSVKASEAMFDQIASPVSVIKHDEPYLDIVKLSRVVKECQEANTNVVLVKLLGSAFRSQSALSMSFLASPLRASPTGEDFGLDLNDIREAYKLIATLPENVSNSLHSAIEFMASELSRTSNSLYHPHQLRQFIILLEYPRLTEPAANKRLLGPLLMALQRLPDSSTTYLDHYFNTWSTDRLIDWNSNLQNMIALNALEYPGDDWNPHDDPMAIAATVAIGTVNRQNEKRSFLSFQDFYSQFINEKLDITEDFKRHYFTDRPHGFYFISTPYILNPEIKSNLLQIESSVSQQLTAREVFFQAFMNNQQESPYLVVRVRRERLIPTSIDALRVESSELKKMLKVKFVDEEGIDEGGVKKEWFQLLVKEIFDAKYGMFTTDHVNRLQWFNPGSTDLSEFELLGKVLGLAVYNAVILDLHFPSIIYKKLLGAKGTLDDLNQINPDLARGLKQLLAYDEKASSESVEDAFCLNFRIAYEVYGHLEAHDLIENGGDIPVTADNRAKYVELYADFLLNASIERQFEHFKKGFSTVCDSKIFRLFRYEELELLLCGSPVLDFEELEENTSYEGFTPDDPTIKNFWTVLHELTLEEKKRFLFFATGTDRAPIGGLARIGLVISKHGEENRLPASHTCFAVVLLAPTPDIDKMRRSIHVVLENAEGFGMI